MYQVQDGYSQYKEIDLAARTAAASPLELVLVLFSGLMDELERARSHIEGRRFEKKAQSINKCIDILNALTSSLEFETGLMALRSALFIIPHKSGFLFRCRMCKLEKSIKFFEILY